ncbi:MAG: Mu transposase C-terminal domain-containing protein, partial [Pseudomonadales bacterium]
VAVARHGVREAERRYANLGIARRSRRILELVEIDHTPLDILAVDEKGIVRGRPMLTLVLDRYSRCVLGFHISLDGHGVHSVFAAFRHALLPKTYLQEGKFAELDLTWPCFGWFERVVMDNGVEFHADAATDALLNLGITGEFARSRQPNDKPHVERLLKTINYSCVHHLPGTTFAKHGERQGVNSEAEAALTLEELDLALHVWLLQKYHRRPHRGLGNKTPLDLWHDSAKAFPPMLKCDPEHLDFEFADRTTSALQHYGIDLNNFRYTSTELMQLRRMLPKNQKVEVKWPRRDVGYIFVWDPFDEKPIKAFNTDAEFTGLSLAQAQAVRRHRAQDLPENRAVRASAGATINQLVDDALASKKLKHRRKGARLAGLNSSLTRAPQRMSRHHDRPTIALAGDAASVEDSDVFEMLERGAEQ